MVNSMEPRRAQKVADCNGCGCRTVLYIRTGEDKYRVPCCGKDECVATIHARAVQIDAADAEALAAGRSFW